MSEDTHATKDEPEPRGDGTDVATLVCRDLAREGGFPRIEADIEARAQLGEEKYGERLQPHNGRDPITDAYQEALDQLMYLRQAMAEGRDVESLYYNTIRNARDLRQMIESHA